jgi:hypothetical protein
VFVDDDITLNHDCLASLMVRMTDGLEHTGPSGICGVGGRKPPAWEDAPPRWLPEVMWWAIGVSYEGLPDRAAPIANVWGDCMLVETKAFLESSGFRSGFGKVDGRSRPDDTEVSLRYSARSAKVWVYEPSAVCTHYVPADRCRYRFFARRSFVQGFGVAGIRQLGLTAERSYLAGTIPRAVWRESRRFAVSLDVLAMARAAVILSGVAFTAAGYICGLLSGE